MKFGALTDETGREKTLTQSSFMSFLVKRDPDLRKRAFHQFYAEFQDHQYTLATALAYSVKANVAYEFPRDISAGLNYHYLAGTPNYATDQITGVPQLGTITIPLEPFGTRRNPALSILNARAAKGFAMKGNKKFVATVELFNALNSSVGTSINYQYGAVGTAREFGFVSTVVPPMIGRIGFEFKF